MENSGGGEDCRSLRLHQVHSKSTLDGIDVPNSAPMLSACSVRHMTLGGDT